MAVGTGILGLVLLSLALLSNQISSSCNIDSSPQKLGMAGGLGSLQESNDDVEKLVNTLKPSILEKVGRKTIQEKSLTESRIKILGYKEQMVAGVNYFVKLDINDQIYHAKIFHQSWTNTLELTELQGPIFTNEEIGFF